jgi:hypothetical protein
LETYEQLKSYVIQLKEDVVRARYSKTEIDEAKDRLQRVKQIDELGSNDSEDTIPLMKQIWLQLVKALLLQKNFKNSSNPPVTFEMTPDASKEPIASLARGECSKLSRLCLEDGELVRPFAERCKSELRYCTWLRELHAAPPSRDHFANDHSREIMKQVDDDIDTQLFTALATSLPPSLAYMRSNVEERSRIGSKFSALCLALEGEANFQKENTNSRSKLSYLDNTQEEQEHSANVALATRIAKDPRGVPVSERITESYKKNVSTDFKLGKRDKRRLDDEEEDSEEKEEPAKVQRILKQQSEEVDPLVGELWNRLFVLESQKARTTAQGNLPCFDFAKGRCKLNPCKYSHASVPDTDSSSSSRSSRPPSPPRERYRSRSPRRKQLPVRFQLSPPPRKDTSYQPFPRGGGKKGGSGGKSGSWKGGKGYNRDRIYEVNPSPGYRGKGAQDRNEPYIPETPPFPPNDHPTACFSMWDTSKCIDRSCKAKHGSSGREGKRDCPSMRIKSHCPFLWQTRGCDFYHGQNHHHGRKNE